MSKRIIKIKKGKNDSIYEVQTDRIFKFIPWPWHTMKKDVCGEKKKAEFDCYPDAVLFCTKEHKDPTFKRVVWTDIDLEPFEFSEGPWVEQLPSGIIPINPNVDDYIMDPGSENLENSYPLVIRKIDKPDGNWELSYEKGPGREIIVTRGKTLDEAVIDAALKISNYLEQGKLKLV